MAFKVCWEDHCTNLKGIEACVSCKCPYCPDHLDEQTDLCMHCVPVDEEGYQNWRRRKADRDRRAARKVQVPE